MRFLASAAALAWAAGVQALGSRIGDIVVLPDHHTATAQWAVLDSPEGIKTTGFTGRLPTSFFATLLSAMRVEVPAVDSLRIDDFVVLDDAFQTPAAQAAALFVVLEARDGERMQLSHSFTYSCDALSAVNQMVSGVTEGSSVTIGNLLANKRTVASVAGDKRFAENTALRAVGSALSQAETAAAMASDDVFAAYAEKIPLDDKATRFLIAELFSVLKGVRELELSSDGSFMSVVVTGLAAVPKSVYADASKLVAHVLAQCSAELNKRTNNNNYAQLVTLVDDRADVDDAVAARVKAALIEWKHPHTVDFPHVHVSDGALVLQACNKVQDALVGTGFGVDCSQTTPRRRSLNGEGLAPISRVWEFQIFLWLTVLFVVLIFVVSTQIAALDPGYDSIIYRVTGDTR